jgi:gamma-glutamyltranspeptidase/glutathione hydrolase
MLVLILGLNASLVLGQTFNARPGGTQKPVLHGNHWMAITGKPLAATAGAMTLTKEVMLLMPRALCWLLLVRCGMC